MAEFHVPDQTHRQPAGNPVLTSSVDAVKAAHEAKSAAQKADLQFLTPEATKKLTMAVELLQKQVNGLRERLEALENEDAITASPYSDGPA